MTKKVIKSLLSLLFVIGIIYGIGSVILNFYQSTNVKAALNRYLRDEKYKDIISYVDSTLKEKPKMKGLLAYKGRALIELGNNEEAINVLQKAIKLDPSDDGALCNLSWAYYNLGEYEEALKYGKYGMEVNPLDEIILANVGNAYLALGQYDEGIKAYNQAIKINSQYANAFYGRGICYMDTEKYEKAIEDFTAYNELITEDTDGLYNLARAYMYSGDKKKAVEVFDSAIKLDKKDLSLYIGKGQALDGDMKYEEAMKCYEYVIQADPEYFDGYFNIGASYYEQGKYKESIKAFQRAIDINKVNSTTYAWMAKVYIAQKDYEKAIEYCDRGISINKRDAFVYNTKSTILYQLEDYDGALAAAKMAIELDNYYEDAYISAASALYRQNNFEEGIKIVEDAMKLFPDSIDVIWSMGDFKSASGKHEDAIKYFEQIYEKNKESSSIIMDLAWEYFYNQDYDKSMEYVTRAEKNNASKEEIKAIRDLLKEAKLPEGQRVANFVKENYLYLKKVKDFDRKAKELSQLGKLDISDINKFMSSIIVQEDHFSYFIYGKEYEAMNQEEMDLHVTTKSMSNNIKYVNIPGFVEQTDNEFVNLADKIEKPEEKNLVIDLRNNPGGSINSANGILDFLLGKTVSSSLVDRSGKAYDYSSDKNQVKFKRIFILVNENSASSSEILTLSLKRNLKNVTVIGHPTYGKGVGQLTFENKKEKYAIFITNFYWNVKNENITGKKIIPDIIVKDSLEESYFKEINKLISN